MLQGRDGTNKPPDKLLYAELGTKNNNNMKAPTSPTKVEYSDVNFDASITSTTASASAESFNAGEHLVSVLVSGSPQ